MQKSSAFLVLEGSDYETDSDIPFFFLAILFENEKEAGHLLVQNTWLSPNVKQESQQPNPAIFGSGQHD